MIDAGKYHLVGSNNFHLKPWMMVPFEEPLTLLERSFNSSLQYTRKVLDQAFDDLRRRFRRCHFIDDPAKCVRIVVASSVIHNICVANGDCCINYFPRTTNSKGEISYVDDSGREPPSFAAQQKRRNICQIISAQV